MSSFDVYGKTNELDVALLDVMATRLEGRGAHPYFQKMMHDYLQVMDLHNADTVLDLGCGTGVVARAIGGQQSFKGKVLGIDLSSHLIEVAQRLAEKEGLGEKLDFYADDSHSLKESDAEFDAVVAHTLISHVDDPLSVLKEASRLLKPGGVVGIFDGDYASLTFSNEDAELGSKYDQLVQKAIVANPRVMRQLPRMLKEAGLELVNTFSYVVADMGQAEFWEPALESWRKIIPDSGVMTAEETNQWVDERLRESSDNVFFAASNFYTYVARRT